MGKIAASRPAATARPGGERSDAMSESSSLGGFRPTLDRNLAFELCRVTEAAAMAAGRWMGRGDKNGADDAAANAMRTTLNNVHMDGILVIGDGGKDQAAKPVI